MSLPLQDSVTHNGDKPNGWKSISLNWLPPTDVSLMDNISFFATVVQKKDTNIIKKQNNSCFSLLSSSYITAYDFRCFQHCELWSDYIIFIYSIYNITKF